jgi:hypothetical protein
VALAAGGAAGVDSARAVSAQQAIAFLNAQRTANGLPGEIVEDPEWSEGCRLHEHYVELNGGIDYSDPHDEDPTKPGYTTLGQTAAKSSVLGASFGADGANGWEDAPLHLMQLLGPGLSVTGYADGCMWTWPGYQRVEPQQPALYSYPNGTIVYYEERADEWPFTPGAFVGLPEGSVTGPYLYVFAFGEGISQVQLTGASLVGPDGPVEARTVDNTTSGPQGNVGAYMPPGGIVIPVSPLQPESSYSASVTGFSGEEPLNWSWTFRTAAKPRIDPGLRLAYRDGGVAVESSNPASVSMTFSRLPSQLVLWRTTASPGEELLLEGRLDGGRYLACADQEGDRQYLAAHACTQLTWRVSAGVRWAPTLVRGSRARLTLLAGNAAGQLAHLTIRSSHRFVSRPLLMRSRLRLWVPRRSSVTLTIRPFAVGERLFAATRLARRVR